MIDTSSLDSVYGIVADRRAKTRKKAMHTATPQDVTPQWLRMDAAERYAGLGRSTLTRLINSRQLRAAKVGKSIRIDRASIDAYMRRHAVGGDES
jgi:excisionase family DNA binding protein